MLLIAKSFYLKPYLINPSSSSSSEDTFPENSTFFRHTGWVSSKICLNNGTAFLRGITFSRNLHKITVTFFRQISKGSCTNHVDRILDNIDPHSLMYADTFLLNSCYFEQTLICPRGSVHGPKDGNIGSELFLALGNAERMLRQC